MNIFFVLLVLISTGGSFSYTNLENLFDLNLNQSECFLSRSLKRLITQLSLKVQTFDVISYGKKEKNMCRMTEILKAKEIHATFEIKTTKISFKNVKSALILSENPKEIADLFEENRLSDSTFNAYFIIVFTKITFPEIDKLFRKMWSKYISNVFVSLHESNQILTFEPFGTGKCHNTLPKVVNESWSSENFFAEKLENLQNCSIKISAMENAPIVIKTNLKNKTYALDGIEVKFLEEIAKSLNFHADIDCSENDHGIIFEHNSSATGNIRHAITGDADMLLGNYFLSSIRVSYLSPTDVYRFDSTSIVCPQNSPYSPIEKLLRPFDLWLFAAIAMCLLLGLSCMFLLQKFLKFKGPSMQLLNLIAIFLGSSQTSLPTMNSLRILFIMFSFHCLILRTVYQGSLYELIQKDDRKNGLKSMDEMVEAKFDFYVSSSFGQTTRGMSFFVRFVLNF